MDIISWIALVQPLVLCIAFAGIQQSGILNSFHDGEREYVADTTDLKDKLRQLEETLVSMESDFKEVDQSIITLIDAVTHIQSDMDLIRPGSIERVDEVDKECVSQDVLVHVAIIILAFLQLVTVILMSVLWIKTSKLQTNTTVNDVIEHKKDEKKENNNSEATS